MTAWIAEDGFEDPGRFTYDVREWAAKLIGGFLRRDFAFHKKDPQGTECPANIAAFVDEGYGDELLAAILDNHERYILWFPARTYSGDGFAAGMWKVEWKRVLGDAPALMTSIRAEHRRRTDAQLWPTLDDWLRADMAGALTYWGAAGGSANLPVDVRNRLSRQAAQRRRRMQRREPRTCTCGVTFMPERANSRHCATCLAAQRQLNGGKRRERR